MQFTRHHVLITIGFLLHLYSNTAYRFLDSFLPVHATRDESASDFEVGIMFSSYCLIIALLSPSFGALCQRHGYRTVIVAGLCLEGATLCLLSLSADLHSAGFIAFLTLFRALEGAGSAATQTGCFAMLAAESGEEGEGAGAGMGGMEMFGGVGNMLGPIVGAWLSSQYGYRTPFLVVGVMGLLSALGTSYVLPSKQQLIDEVDLHFIARNTLPMVAPASSSADGPQSSSPSSTSTSESFTYVVPASASAPAVPSSSRTDVSTSVRAFVGEDLQTAQVGPPPPAVGVLTVLAVPTVVYSCVVSAVGLGCMSFLSATLELALERQHGLSDLEVGMAFALMSFVQLLFCPIAGYIADRLPTKLPMVVGLATLLLSLLLLGPSPIMPFGPSLPVQLIALCMLGAGVSLAVIPTFVDELKGTAHLGTSSQPVIAGLSASVHSLGEVLGPFMGSALVSLTSFEVACSCLSLLCAAVLAAGATLLWFGIIPWDVGKARQLALQRGDADEEDRIMGGAEHAKGKGPGGVRRVKGMVELIANKVSHEKRRRAGYEKADLSTSPFSSPESAPHRHGTRGRYSPNASFILPSRDSPAPLSPRSSSKSHDDGGEESKEAEERQEPLHHPHRRGYSSDEEDGMDVMELGDADDDLEDVDVVGDAGSLVDYDLDPADEEKQHSDADDNDGNAALHISIRPAQPPLEQQ